MVCRHLARHRVIDSRASEEDVRYHASIADGLTTRVKVEDDGDGLPVAMELKIPDMKELEEPRRVEESVRPSEPVNVISMGHGAFRPYAASLAPAESVVSVVQQSSSLSSSQKPSVKTLSQSSIRSFFTKSSSS